VKKKDSPILFYHVHEKWGEFSNFAEGFKIKARIKQNVNSPIDQSIFLTELLSWKTSEHLFQALKFSDGKVDSLELIMKINFCSSAKEARKIANSSENKIFIRKDWHYGYKLSAMRWVIWEKVRQNPEFRELLISTNGRKIVENTSLASYDDSFWGNGPNGKGKNNLGIILEEIRNCLLDKINNSGRESCIYVINKEERKNKNEKKVEDEFGRKSENFSEEKDNETKNVEKREFLSNKAALPGKNTIYENMGNNHHFLTLFLLGFFLPFIVVLSIFMINFKFEKKSNRNKISY